MFAPDRNSLVHYGHMGERSWNFIINQSSVPLVLNIKALLKFIPPSHLIKEYIMNVKNIWAIVKK